MKRQATAKLALVHTDLAQQWANRINRHAGDAVASILAMGRDLIAAKKPLHHGGWGRMFAGHREAVQEPLRFNRHTAFKLMAIAGHSVLANVSHGKHLPLSWVTLYELTTIKPPERLEGFIAEGRIHPDITRRQVGAMKGRKKKRPAASGPRDVPHVDRKQLLHDLPPALQELLQATENAVLNVRHAAHRPVVAKYLRALAEGVRPFRLEASDPEEE